MLDLFNMQALAEEIAEYPSGSTVKRLAKQIVDNCEMADVAAVRQMAEQLRSSDSPDERQALAHQIIAELGAMLDARDAETSTPIPFPAVV